MLCYVVHTSKKAFSTKSSQKKTAVGVCDLQINKELLTGECGSTKK